MNNKNLIQTFVNNGGPITYFQNFEDAQLAYLDLGDDPSFTTPADSTWEDGTERSGVCADYAPPAEKVCGGGGIVSRIGEVCYPDGADTTDLKTALTGKTSMYKYCNEDDAAWRCVKSCRTVPGELVNWVDETAMRANEMLRFYPGPDATYTIPDRTGNNPDGTEIANDVDEDVSMRPTRVTAIFYYRELKVTEAWVTIMYKPINSLSVVSSDRRFQRRVRRAARRSFAISLRLSFLQRRTMRQAAARRPKATPAVAPSVLPQSSQ